MKALTFYLLFKQNSTFQFLIPYISSQYCKSQEQCILAARHLEFIFFAQLLLLPIEVSNNLKRFTSFSEKNPDKK